MVDALKDLGYLQDFTRIDGKVSVYNFYARERSEALEGEELEASMDLLDRVFSNAYEVIPEIRAELEDYKETLVNTQ